jgi:hypothetical protein
VTPKRRVKTRSGRSSILQLGQARGAWYETYKKIPLFYIFYIGEIFE